MNPNAEIIYSYFLSALREMAEKEGRGIQVAWAMEIEKTPTAVNQILSGKAKAGFAAQVALAGACGYNYIDFLVYGRKILESDTLPDTEDKTQQLPAELLKKLANLDSRRLKSLNAWIDGLGFDQALITKLSTLDRRGIQFLSTWMDGFLAREQDEPKAS